MGDVYISRRFTVSYIFGNRLVGKAICDLGSGVSVMPLSITTSIGLVNDTKPAQLTLQLMDKSLVKPNGFVENVLVKVDKLVLPMDFVILEMKEDDDASMIVGRPFLSTRDVTIGVKDKSTVFHVDGEEMIFYISYAMKCLEKSKECRDLENKEMCVEELLASEANSTMESSFSTSTNGLEDELNESEELQLLVEENE